jgi:hypothetical protein
MFPKTELDEATAILQHLEGDVEKARSAVDKASERLFEATVRVNKQKHVVKMIQAQMPAVDAITGEVQE